MKNTPSKTPLRSRFFVFRFSVGSRLPWLAKATQESSNCAGKIPFEGPQKRHFSSSNDSIQFLKNQVFCLDETVLRQVIVNNFPCRSFGPRNSNFTKRVASVSVGHSKTIKNHSLNTLGITSIGSKHGQVDMVSSHPQALRHDRVVA